MDKIKVMSVFGTRPEAIKMAPLVKALEKEELTESIVCVTAQHREMLDQVLNDFEIVPDYDLNIMKAGQTLEDITVRELTGIGDVIRKEKPDIVLVHGDTSTTFAASLAAYYNQTKVGHVEAGLRTYDKYQPFPEEMNRRLTGAMADNDYVFTVEELNKIDYKAKRVITVTAHRRENLGEPLENICNALKKIIDNYDDVELVYAVHKNPAVSNTVHRILGGNERIQLLDPLDLRDMHNLMNRSFMVMTDSGGHQEEVPSMGKPVLVLRNDTERPEGVEAGTLKLVGTDTDTVYTMAKELLENKEEYMKMAVAKNPFGDGNASERIVNAILYSFGKISERPEDYITKE